VYSKPSSAKEVSSLLTTSDNVIVEAVRREGEEIEVRMAEAFGRSGEAELKLHLSHSAARLTNLVGQTIQKLNSGGVYRFPVRPQQIVTLRFKTEKPVAAIVPLTDWNPLVPANKRAALNTFIDKKGHPPRGDNK
jgi:D-aminopeptidase